MGCEGQQLCCHREGSQNLEQWVKDPWLTMSLVEMEILVESNQHIVMRVLGEKREKEAEVMYIKIMSENVPCLIKTLIYMPKKFREFQVGKAYGGL